MPRKCQLLIIGAGPAGYSAAIHASKTGLNVTLIEQKDVGGTCLNRGCIPTKVMLDAAADINYPKAYLTCQLDSSILFRHRGQVINKLRKGVEYLLQKNKITLIRGKAAFLSKNCIQVSTETEVETLEFENALIATGSVPRNLPILYQFEEYVIDSDQATSLTEVPKSLAIIGGGPVGVEFAYIYKALGSDVALIEGTPRLLPNEDYIVSDFVQKTLKQIGIKVLTNAMVEEVTASNNRIIISIDSKGLDFEKVLCAIGRKPNAHELNIENIGLELDKTGRIQTNEYLQTKNENIYAVGDVTGGMMLAHVASSQAITAVKNIISKNALVWDGSYVSKCVYINPEVASVGLTEEEVKKLNTPYMAEIFPMLANGKAVATGHESGFIKVISKASDKQIIGVHVVGPRATDLIAQAMLFIKDGYRVNDLENAIYPHPTYSEALFEAVLKLENKAIHY